VLLYLRLSDNNDHKLSYRGVERESIR